MATLDLVEAYAPDAYLLGRQADKLCRGAFRGLELPNKPRPIGMGDDCGKSVLFACGRKPMYSKLDLVPQEFYL